MASPQCAIYATDCENHAMNDTKCFKNSKLIFSQELSNLSETASQIDTNIRKDTIFTFKYNTIRFLTSNSN